MRFTFKHQWECLHQCVGARYRVDRGNFQPIYILKTDYRLPSINLFLLSRFSVNYILVKFIHNKLFNLLASYNNNYRPITSASSHSRFSGSKILFTLLISISYVIIFCLLSAVELIKVIVILD